VAEGDHGQTVERIEQLDGGRAVGAFEIAQPAFEMRLGMLEFALRAVELGEVA
jgi:hypothetical protein